MTTTTSADTGQRAEMAWRKPELVCPAGSLPALKAAVDEAGYQAVSIR